MAGSIAPFLFLGEVVFAVAGSAAARLWSNESVLQSGKSFVFGGLLALCAFLWDLETNFGTALIAYWPSLTAAKIGVTILLGVPFMLSHEVSDFLLGALFVPLIILIVPRLAPNYRPGLRPILRKQRD
jgi:hypothetical protein